MPLNSGLVVVAALVMLPAATARGQATTDGSVGPVVTFDAPSFEVPASTGTQRGSNLFHSFDSFRISQDGSATFTALGTDEPILTVIARVTGGEPSRMDGPLRSTIGEQHFFFLNPSGVLFGAGARIELGGSFLTGSAHSVDFADGSSFDTSGLESTPPSAAPISSLSFTTCCPAPVEIQGRLGVGPSRSLVVAGGDVTISGGGGEFGAELSAPEGDLWLLSARSTGRLYLGDEPSVEGFADFGSITIRSESVLTSTRLPVLEFNGTSGILESIANFDLANVSAAELGYFGRATSQQGELLAGTYPLPDGTPVDVYFNVFPQTEGSGSIWIRGGDLTLVDSEIRAVNAGGFAGGIDVTLSRDLRLQREASSRDVGLFTGGIPFAGTLAYRVAIGGAPARTFFFPIASGFGGDGPAGTIRVSARSASLEGGAAISSVSFGRGAGGVIDLSLSGDLSISGLSPEGVVRGLFSNAQGTGRAGDITVSAGDVRLDDGGAIIAQTTGDAPGGDITLDVGTLEILGTGQIDTSTSAQRFDLLSDADLRGRTTSGAGGRIDVAAREGVSISGRGSVDSFSRISTFSKARSAGVAGSIDVRSPSLVITDGGGIAVTSEGPGDAGNIALHVSELELRDGAAVTASAAQSKGGDVFVMADSLVHVKKSTLSARAPLGHGGNVKIDPRFVVLNDAEIVADAVTGEGGSIDIASRYLFRSADSRIDASSQFGVSGTVVIRSPEVDLSGELAQLPADLLGTDTELDRRCAERGAAGRGSFVLRGYGGTPDTPDRLRSARYSLAEDGASLASRRRGDFESEVVHWRAAAGAAATDRERAGAQLELAQVEESTGAYTAALSALEDAKRWSRSSGTSAEQAALLAVGGRILARRGTAAAGLAELDRAHSLAAGHPSLRAQIALDRAHLLVQLGHAQEAATAYGNAEQLARAEGLEWLAALSRAGGATDPAELDAAGRALGALPPTHETLFALLHVGRKLDTLSRSAAGSVSDDLRLQAGTLFSQAARTATEIGAALAASYAWGYLGGLYEQEGRSDEALELTRRALTEATRAESPASSYLGQWQLGRLESARGRPDAAIRAYEAAHRTLRALRTRAALEGAAHRALGREFPVEPVARGLVDVLLRRAASAEDVAERETLLRRARDRMEDLNAADLQDYFEDECVAAQRHAPADTLPGAAVLYPISLPDRLELVLSLPSGIRSVRVPVAADALAAVARQFVRLLQDPRSEQYRVPAAHLYDWLVRPVEDDLEGADVRVLVVVPSGGVRGLPFAALYDSRRKRLLIQDHAVAVVPGLSLTDPRPIDRGSLELLKAGLTKGVQGYPALPRVAEEVASIGTMFRGPTLLDEGFVAAALSDAIANRAFGAVHLASHAEFGASADDAFVLTYDEKLSVARLAEIVRGTSLREQPLELLALSACQTALGDERAALGIAGLALQAGARSTLATLWSVDDEATARLVAEFYRRLAEPGTSRAAALQGAQLALVESREFAHPTYWSAFLLIGSWL